MCACACVYEGYKCWQAKADSNYGKNSAVTNDKLHKKQKAATNLKRRSSEMITDSDWMKKIQCQSWQHFFAGKLKSLKKKTRVKPFETRNHLIPVW